MATLLLDDVRDYLQASGVTGQIVCGRVTENLDKAVFLIETSGRPPEYAMAATQNAVLEYPRVQVISRAKTYQGARQVAQQVFTLLDGMAAQTINGTRYLWSSAVQSPFWLGDDDNDRPMVVCNYEIVKAVSTSTTT